MGICTGTTPPLPSAISLPGDGRHARRRKKINKNIAFVFREYVLSIAIVLSRQTIVINDILLISLIIA